MNIHDDPINVEYHPLDAEDSEPEHCEKYRAKGNWDHNLTTPSSTKLIYA